MKKVLVLIFSFTLLFCALLSAGCGDKKSKKDNRVKIAFSDGLAYEEGETECTLMGVGEFTGSELVVPDEYNGKPITKIAAQAFSGQTSINSVSLGDNVSEIGEDAFSGCTSLGKTVFRGELEGWCEIEFANPSSNPLSINGWFYLNDGNVYVAEDLVTQLVFYKNVEVIKKYAFYNCKSVVRINVALYVTTIEEQAFKGCSNVVEVIMEKCVTSVGEGAFAGCSQLTRMALACVGSESEPTGNSPKYLLGFMFGEEEFEGSYKVKQYYNLDDYKEYYIPSQLSSLNIMEGKIAYGACYNCSSLQSVTIGNNVTSIGARAFAYCYNVDFVFFENKDSWLISVSEKGSASPVTELKTCTERQAANLLTVQYATYYWKTEAVTSESE